MAMNEAELAQKRTELKQQLAAGEYQTLVDVILNGTGRLTQKLTRNPKPISFWFSGVLIALITLLIGFLTSIFLGEFFSLRREMILLEISIVGLGFAWIITSKIYIGIAFTTWQDHLLDTIESTRNLTDFRHWLNTVCSVNKTLLFSLAFSLVISLYSFVSIVMTRGGFIGFGPVTISLIVQFQTGLFVYYVLLVLVILPIRSSQYQFKLHPVDPSSSEVINNLSDMLTSFLYITAILAVVNTLIVAFLIPANITFFILGWILIIALFILNQYVLSKIITKAKSKKLGEIQIRIEKLEAKGNITDKETMEAINRLMDYHDRIRSTRNSALDFRAGLSFLNSLLLPLIAFVLSNLDQIRGFF
jgi:hypothetical protein